MGQVDDVGRGQTGIGLSLRESSIQFPDILSETNETYSRLIRAKALELGFSACGIARVHPLEEHRQPLQEWLDAGYHGTMAYMANHFEKRLDPAQLVEGAKTVISVLLNYFPARQPADPSALLISKYAYGKDYHFVVKEKLNQLLLFIQQEIGPTEGRAFTDSAPVLERAWAREAGLGWIGKNSLLINPKAGSFHFIGELIIDRELGYDISYLQNRCGSCTRCIDACPTGAIIAPAQIDARRCISYLTIETKEEIPEDLGPKLSNRILGCDICQDVCPWNRKVIPTSEPGLQPSDRLMAMTRQDWEQLDKTTYNQLFKNSAAERTGFKKLVRNIGYLTDKK